MNTDTMAALDSLSVAFGVPAARAEDARAAAPVVDIITPRTKSEWAEAREVALGLFQFLKDGLDFDMLAEQEGAIDELDNLDRFYAPPQGRFFAGRVDGRIVATTAVKLDTPEVAELKRVFVLPEARGLKLAPRMLEAAIEAAREMGARSLWLETASQIMRTAIRMYRWSGFREVGSYTTRGVTGLVMEKPLLDEDAPVPALDEILALSRFKADSKEPAR